MSENKEQQDSVPLELKALRKRVVELGRQLKQAQKMGAVGLLSGGIAHEFNNLLMPILGNAELLLDEKPEDDPDRPGLLQIQEVANRACELVQQMMTYGRKSQSKIVAMSLENTVADVAELIKHSIDSSIVVKKEIEDSLPAVLGMPNELNQVLLNLCLNACHAMGGGGELTVKLEKDKGAKFHSLKGLSRSEDFVVMSVQDTGSGMSPDILSRIFDPFFSTKDAAQGSGLGLSVVQRIMTQHRGLIDIKTIEDEGSTFYVYLPLAGKEAVVPKVENKPRSVGSKKILFVDDERVNRDVSKRMLEKLGYEVDTYEDCEKALKFFSARSQDIDLVITDYGMPTMNGKQLSDKLREIRPDIPVILFTGYGDLVTKDNIGEWGMNALLIKPAKYEEFGRTVREVLDRN